MVNHFTFLIAIKNKAEVLFVESNLFNGISY